MYLMSTITGRCKNKLQKLQVEMVRLRGLQQIDSPMRETGPTRQVNVPKLILEIEI